MGLAWIDISVDIEDENIESITFTQNGHHVTTTTTSSYQITMFDLRKAEFVATAPTEGLVVHVSHKTLHWFWSI